jgi:hypothetical protein
VPFARCAARFLIDGHEQVNERIKAAANASAASYHRLNLGRCGLTDEMVASIDWASMGHSVRVLDLSGNALTTLPVTLGSLGNLEELSLYKNQVLACSSF